MNLSDAVIVALIVAFPTTITAIATLVVSMRNSRKLDEVHHATNGMHTQMMASARKEGVAEGKADEQANPTTESVPKKDYQ